MNRVILWDASESLRFFKRVLQVLITGCLLKEVQVFFNLGLIVMIVPLIDWINQHFLV